jgi:hypothetical protein
MTRFNRDLQISPCCRDGLPNPRDGWRLYFGNRICDYARNSPRVRGPCVVTVPPNLATVPRASSPAERESDLPRARIGQPTIEGNST